MKIKFLTTATDLSRTTQLVRSLKYFGYDYQIVQHAWTGFGSKLVAARNALTQLFNDGYTHFVYADSYDSFVLGAVSDIVHKYKDTSSIVHGCEKANYPHSEFVYPEPLNSNPWKYLNGGNFIAPIELYLKIFDECPIPDWHTNDQVYQRDQYVKYAKTGEIKLEKEPSIFQCYSFIDETNDYAYLPSVSKLFNKVTSTFPTIIHGNGKTDMTRIYNLIK